MLANLLPLDWPSVGIRKARMDGKGCHHHQKGGITLQMSMSCWEQRFLGVILGRTVSICRPGPDTQVDVTKKRPRNVAPEKRKDSRPDSRAGGPLRASRNAMRMRGCHRNLSGNDRAVAEAAVLDQEADTESTVQGRTQDRSREFTSRCKMAECHPRGLRQISPPPSRDKLLKSSSRHQPGRRRQGGVGLTYNRRILFSNPSKPCLLPTHWVWLRGQQETVSSQRRANFSPPSAV